MCTIKPASRSKHVQVLQVIWMRLCDTEIKQIADAVCSSWMACGSWWNGPGCSAHPSLSVLCNFFGWLSAARDSGDRTLFFRLRSAWYMRLLLSSFRPSLDFVPTTLLFFWLGFFFSALHLFFCSWFRRYFRVLVPSYWFSKNLGVHGLNELLEAFQISSIQASIYILSWAGLELSVVGSSMRGCLLC